MWGCTYGRKRPSIATDSRPHAHSKKKNCKFSIRFYCSPADEEGKTKCVLASFTEEHNHARTIKMWEQDTQKIEKTEEKEWLVDATKMSVKPNQIKNLMKLKFGKTSISTKHIQYMQKKLTGPNNEKDDLATYLEEIEKEGARVEVMLDKCNKVRVLVVQTPEMKRAYMGANPDVCQVDTTFRFESSGYKMTVFLYLNPVTNRGEVAQFAFMSDEGAEAYEFIFRAFKMASKRDPPIIILDKDFNELKVINRVFPDTTPLLCLFHVLKWWKGLIKTAKKETGDILGYDGKKEIMEAFTDLVYAHSSDISQERKVRFEKIIAGVEVRVGNGDQAYFVNLQEYFSKNWVECETMWMMAHRKNIVGLEEENTNNRIERLWRTLKDYLKQMASGQMSIHKAVKTLVKFEEERIDDKYVWDQRHTMCLFDRDPSVKEEYANAAVKLNDRGMKKFKESVDMMRKRAAMMKVCNDEDGRDCIKEIFNNKECTDRMDIVEEDVLHLEDDDEDTGVTKDEYDDDEKKLNVKFYKTDVQSCNCSWSVRAGSPCRHVLFLRKSKDLDLFDPSLFNNRFMKERNQDLSTDVHKNDQEFDRFEADNEKRFEDDLLDDDSKKYEKNAVMNRGEKYKAIGPVCERLLESIMRCGTSLVEEYREELEICVDNVKNGRSLFFKDHKNNVEANTDHPQASQVSTDAGQGGVDAGRADAVASQVSNDAGHIKAAPRKKFDFDWHTSMKMGGKVGRPSDSKTKFKLKSVKTKKPSKSKIGKRKPASYTPLLYSSTAGGKKKGKSSSSKKEAEKQNLKPVDTPLICSFPHNPAKPRQNAIFEGDLACLAPGSFVSDEICDFKIRQLQPAGPAGQVVWLLSNKLGQQIGGRYWEAPELTRQLQEAKLYQDGGCKFVFLPWCERSHFFALIFVCGPQDRLYIMESIGSYGEPVGAGLLKDLMRQVRAGNNWDPVDCMTFTLDSPKQRTGSNDCAFFMLETATMLLGDPTDFCARAETNDMLTWYGSNLVHGRRKEMIYMLMRMREEQRKSGEILVSEENMDLSVLPLRKVLEGKSGERLQPSKSRLCGLCREPGHNGKR